MEEGNNKDAELSRVSAELASTKHRLEDERRKREDDLDRRLDNIDDGQKEILKQVGEVKLTYATAVKLEKLEARVDAQQKIILLATGGLLVIQFAIPLALHFWK